MGSGPTANHSLSYVRRELIRSLWEQYRSRLPQVGAIETALQRRGEAAPPLIDHLLIFDLPGPYTGLRVLEALFNAIGFVTRGNIALPDRKSEYVWLAEEDLGSTAASKVLPQIVLGGFGVTTYSPQVGVLIAKYARKAAPAPLVEVESLASAVRRGDSRAAADLLDLVSSYLTSSDRALPTPQDYAVVCKENDLLAWTLVRGREVNHVGLAVHYLTTFASLDAFNDFVEEVTDEPLNQSGGSVIKGGPEGLIAQSATVSPQLEIPGDGGALSLPTSFVEFVWRYPNPSNGQAASTDDWHFLYRDFTQANGERVMDSLYNRGTRSACAGQLFLDAGLISRETLEDALARQRLSRAPIGEILVSMGAIRKDDLLRALAKQRSLAFLSQSGFPPAVPVFENFSLAYLRHYRVCPLSIAGATLTVATSDPSNPLLLDDLRQMAGLDIELVIAPEAAVLHAAEKAYGGAQHVPVP